MLDGETLFVTGAGGFIGGWIVEAGALATSARIRAGIRRWSTAARISRFPVDIVSLDIMDERGIPEALEGSSAVVHCASGGGEVIVEGTRNMLEASLRAGVKRFVYMSSAEVYGNASGDVGEDAVRRPTGKEYGDAKIEAEKACLEYSGKGLYVVILRPGIVYGPFSKTWTITMALRLASGKWGTFGESGGGTCNLIYVGDLVRAVFASIASGGCGGEAFNINGAERVTWNEYFERFNEALGFPGLKASSAGLVRLRALAAEPLKRSAKMVMKRWRRTVSRLARRYDSAGFLMKGIEGSLKATPNAKDLALYGRKAYYVGTKARERLGFTPQVGLDEGLSLCALWLRHHGIVPAAPAESQAGGAAERAFAGAAR